MVPTIYPPVAEAYFLGVHYLPTASNSSTPIQATTALVAVLVTVLLLFGLGRLGRDIRMAALWSWCPTVILEAGNSAHVDVVAVGITAAAILVLATARTTRRTILGGVLLGLAIATKMTPALTVPALLRRRWVTVALAAGSAFVAVYVPHVIRVGGKVIGFLPGYLQQEGYTKGTRFGIIGLFVTGPLAIAVAALILGAVAFAVLQFSDPDRPWQGAVYMTAAALAVATPHYQWYSLLLVMLVALDGRPEWLAFAAGGYYAAYPNMGRVHPSLAVRRRHRLRRAPGGRGRRLAGPPRARPPRSHQRAAARGRCTRRTRDRRGVHGARPRRARRARPPAAPGPAQRGVAESPGLTCPANRRRFLTGWLPAGQTSNCTGYQDRE